MGTLAGHCRTILYTLCGPLRHESVSPVPEPDEGEEEDDRVSRRGLKTRYPLPTEILAFALGSRFEYEDQSAL